MSGASDYVPRGKKSGTASSVGDNKSDVSDYVPRGIKSGVSVYLPRGKKYGFFWICPTGKKSPAKLFLGLTIEDGKKN